MSTGRQNTRALAIAAAVVLACAFVVSARASSTPIGPLPAGPASTITTSPNQLVAVALPHQRAGSGLVWRLARTFDARVVRQVGEADVGANVVLVYKVVGRGSTSLVFAVTKGDSSGKALASRTFKIRAS